MTTQSLIEIASTFDNVQIIKLPSFLHIWIDENGVCHSQPTSMAENKFKHSEFLDYLEEQRSFGNSVYILEDSYRTMYDAMSFEPILALRIKSIFGYTKKRNIKEESSVTNDFDKFKYLLIR